MVKRGKSPQLRNDTPYAGVIEHGRRPNRPGPPLAPIVDWVRRKMLGMKRPGKRPSATTVHWEAEIESIAWAIKQATHSSQGLGPTHDGNSELGYAIASVCPSHR